jgi:hypothetical protein
MSEKHWYQDGWVVLAIVAVVGFLTLSYWHNNNKAASAASRVAARFDARFNEPLDGPATLDVDVWHLRPEVVQNIQVIVLVSTDNTNWNDQSRSLVEWSPNREHQVSFSFPIKRPTADVPVYLKVYVGGRRNQLAVYRMKWQDGQWQADLSDKK